MTDVPAKVTPLFGDYVPSAGTSQTIVDSSARAAEALLQRKMVAFGAVAIDDEGQPHMFYARDPLKNPVLAGGLAYLQHHIYMLMREDLVETASPPKGSPDEPAS